MSSHSLLLLLDFTTRELLLYHHPATVLKVALALQQQPNSRTGWTDCWVARKANEQTTTREAERTDLLLHIVGVLRYSGAAAAQWWYIPASRSTRRNKWLSSFCTFVHIKRFSALIPSASTKRAFVANTSCRAVSVSLCPYDVTSSGLIESI